MRIVIIILLLIITAVIVAAGFVLGAVRRFFFGSLLKNAQILRPDMSERESKKDDEVMYSDGKVTVLRGEQQMKKDLKE